MLVADTGVVRRFCALGATGHDEVAPRPQMRAARIRFGRSLLAIGAAWAWPIAVVAPRREELRLRPRTDPAKGRIGVNGIRDGARKLCDATYARDDIGALSRGHRGSWQTRLASDT
jgi:hypothetical protein